MKKKKKFSLFICIFFFCFAKGIQPVPYQCITETSKKELEIERVIKALNQTSTQKGLEKLSFLISNPTADVSIIKDRQAIIKKLIDNPLLLEKIQESILKIATLKSDLLISSNIFEQLNQYGLGELKIPYNVSVNYKDDTALVPQSIDIQWWKPKIQTPGYFDLLFLLKQGVSFAEFLALLGLKGLAMRIFEEGKRKADIPSYHSPYFDTKSSSEGLLWIKNTYISCIKESFNWLNFTKNNIIDSKKTTPTDFFKICYLNPTGKDIFSFYTNNLQQQAITHIPDAISSNCPSIIATLAKRSLQAFAMPIAGIHMFHGYTLPFWTLLKNTGIAVIAKRIKILFIAQKQLTKFKDILVEFKNLASLIHNNIPELHETCKELLNWHLNASPECKELLLLLSSSTFEQSKWLIRPGNIIKAAHLLQESRNEIATIYESFGSIDMYASLATMYKNTQESRLPFCFAEFINSQDTYLAIQDFWLPPILENKNLSLYDVVTNTVKLGTHTTQKIIITGPNGTGKSIVLKGIGIATILAQTIGIVPATAYTASIIHSIQTSISPDEDSRIGMSRFGSELLVLEEIKQNVEKNSAQKLNSLLLIDEPCRGTHPEETALRFCTFAQALTESKNIIFVCASHSADVSKLEQRTKKKFANYHMLVNETSPGIFDRTFAIIPGPADWWFKDSAKRKRYVDWFLKYIVKPKAHINK